MLFRSRFHPMLPKETFAHGIQRAGADIAIHDSERPNRQRQHIFRIASASYRRGHRTSDDAGPFVSWDRPFNCPEVSGRTDCSKFKVQSATSKSLKCSDIRSFGQPINRDCSVITPYAFTSSCAIIAHGSSCAAKIFKNFGGFFGDFARIMVNAPADSVGRVCKDLGSSEKRRVLAV